MFQHTCLLSYKRSAVLRHVRDVVKEAQVGCNSRMFAFVAVFGRSAWGSGCGVIGDGARTTAAVRARERALMLGGRNNDVYFRRRVAPMHQRSQRGEPPVLIYTYEENLLLLPRMIRRCDTRICRGWELASTPTHMCSLPACLLTTAERCIPLLC